MGIARLGMGADISLIRKRQIIRTQPDPALISPYRLVFTRGHMPGGPDITQLSDGNLSQIMLITRFQPLRVAPVFANIQVTNDPPYGEINSANDVTIRFAWEYTTTASAGTVVQGTFSGANSATMAPGQIIVGDFVEGGVWPGSSAGKWPLSRVYAFKTEFTVTGGGNWPCSSRGGTTYANTAQLSGSRSDAFGVGTTAALGNKVYAQGTPDFTGFTYTGSNVFGVQPVAWIGQYDTSDYSKVPPAIFWMGDSIADIYASMTPINWGNAFSGSDGNFMENACRSRSAPYVHGALASAQMLRGYSSGNTLFKNIVRYCSHVVIEDCTNDQGAGLSGATLYATVQQIIQDCLVRGVKGIYALPAVPRTSSSDSFATEANQGSGSIWDKGGAADDYYELLRSGAGTATGVTNFVDIRAAVCGLDPHKWFVDGTTNGSTLDGIHPRNSGGVSPTAARRMSERMVREMANWTLY